jgi:secretion/DNA translocation related CpaE-like protein
MTSPPVLLTTTDDLLLDDVLRLAAAAGTEVEVAHDPGAALRAWQGAAAVLVGGDQAGRLARLRPPRRDHVHVVGRGAAADALYREALACGARDVLELPADDAWLVELLTDLGDLAGRGVAGTLLGVLGGSGGAGATTLACAVAAVAAPRRGTVLVDLDPLGPGVDRVIGLDLPVPDDPAVLPGRRQGDRDVGPVCWDDLVAASGRLGSRALREALPRCGPLRVLGWGARPAGEVDPVAVREVLSAARRGHSLVVADLPRSLDPVTTEVLARCEQVLVVVDSGVPGVTAAARLVARLAPVNEAVGLVVRAGSGLAAEQVGEALGLQVVAELRHQRRLAEDVDLGLGPVRSRRSPLARAAHEVLAALPGPAESAGPSHARPAAARAEGDWAETDRADGRRAAS